MVSARAHYVHARRNAFPNAEAWISGPFDTYTECNTETHRLAPFYPECLLRPRVFHGKTLPACSPRTGPPGAEPAYDLAKRPERERAAADLKARAEAFGATVVVENWDGEPDVQISTPALQANIWLAYLRDAPMPMISWYGANYPLRAVPGAWDAEHVNRFHRSKASSVPATWGELFDALEIGICAAIDGTAFQLEETDA